MDAIRIHHADSDEEVKARHDQIVSRLKHFEREQIRMLVNTGGLPTQWNPVILAWLKGQASVQVEPQDAQVATPDGDRIIDNGDDEEV